MITELGMDDEVIGLTTGGGHKVLNIHEGQIIGEYDILSFILIKKPYMNRRKGFFITVEPVTAELCFSGPPDDYAVLYPDGRVSTFDRDYDSRLEFEITLRNELKRKTEAAE